MMFRIRRRFALSLSVISILLFFLIYFYFMESIEEENKQPNFDALAKKLQKLENGMTNLKNRIETNLRRNVNKIYDTDEQRQQPLVIKKPKTNDNADDSKNNINEDEQDDGFKQVVPAPEEEEECTALIDLQQVPQPDVQMLDMYNKMSFADVDGGVWKQGWDIKYDPKQYSDHRKLRVFVVPHSHNDPGWIKTFEDYYEHDTKHILSNALRHLREYPDMRFIWAEISYFSRFFEELGLDNKNEMKKLVRDGQLEFVSGGWVMPDEANSHWFSILMQLTEGQSWLKKHLNVTPISSWSIDPFGYSATVPYILKKSGFQNHLIQRTHYSVKKALAQQRQLEFHWRQIWDDTGNTDLFTHMMPFYSYDIPHTCGPDPKICCQFDFKRISGFGLSCPWRVPPKQINERNVAERAELLVDQWKKKAELYRTTALLIPLGDDFRYSQSIEWDAQRRNYETLFDHINSERKYFVEAKFGTLQEYFDAVHQEEKAQKREFPVLSGDFFTYADRTDNYWSGYFTSRPFHKRMDRVLLHYIRSAEMLASWHAWEPETKFAERLQQARRELSLFQHHDGITGTAKTHVMKDYARRMLDAVQNCKFVMQQAVYRLLTKPTIYMPNNEFNYFYLDDSRWPGPDDSRATIILGEELPLKFISLHNSLPRWREELVDFYVSSPFVHVRDFNGNAVHAQINPVWSWHRQSLEEGASITTPQASTTKYRLIFRARVPPLGLVTYRIELQPADVKSQYTSFASNTILATDPFSVHLGSYPEDVQFGEHREISMRVGKGPKVAFSADGHMKSIQIDEESADMPVHLKFYKYGTRISGERSGAYLFLPNGPATAFVNMQPPVVLIIEGKLESSVTVGLPFVTHQTILRGDDAPEIRNLVNVSNMEDTEVVMRFATHIKSANIFYTDLNGLQVIKRQRFSKLPIQANYYPVPGAIYIEDESVRLTVVTAQPLGGSSLAQGEIEIMQDRRLTHDDERGLGQGVLDNEPVLHIFRLALEKIKDCSKLPEMHPAGALTLTAHTASRSILHPIDKFIFSENDWVGVQRDFGASHQELDQETDIVVMRNLETRRLGTAVARDRAQHFAMKTGLVLHRTSVLHCQGDAQSTGLFNLRNTLDLNPKNVTSVYATTLTFLHKQGDKAIDINAQHLLCSMDTKAYILETRS